MKVETLVGGSAALAAIVVALYAPATEGAGPSSAAPGKNSPLKLEDIPGSTVKRITLTEKAVQRLGIETGKVVEQPITLKQMVGGLVVAAAAQQPAQEPAASGGRSVFGGFESVSIAAASGAAPGAAPVGAYKGGSGPGETLIEVTLSRAEWERLDKAQPARLMPLATRVRPGNDIAAKPSGMQPVEDTKRSMLKAYYVIPEQPDGLQPNKRVRVELALSGSDEKRKAVPYSAIYYDAKGTPWVYLNPAPLVFHRQQVRVERVVGDLAVLSEGPAVGTTVVTVGAPLLYGTEIFKK